MTVAHKTMRDVLIEELTEQMADNHSIYFLTADLGAPALDRMRSSYPKRCINVGIAEQNLIAIATGLALEGRTVYVYGIAPFITMRAYEQIRINLALLSQTRKMNVNIMSLGVGFSYDVSGPTHHCVEDITLMRLLPNIDFFSPSDSFMVKQYVDYSMTVAKPKYLRLDGKPQGQIYHEKGQIDFNAGFTALLSGEKVCLVSTGHMTHKALQVAETLSTEGIRVGVVDLYFLKNYDEDALAAILKNYSHVFTMEESFINKGGLDSLVASIISNRELSVRLKRFGLDDRYIFDNGGRDYIHKAYGMDSATIIEEVRRKSDG